MDTLKAFGLALRQVRKVKEMTQEDFDEVVTRAYVSGLERGINNPTLKLIEALSESMGVQPLTLLLATYAAKHPRSSPEELIRAALDELKALQVE